MSLKQLLRQKLQDPKQLALQLDMFSQNDSAGPSAAPQPVTIPSLTPAALSVPAAPPPLASGRRRLQLDQHFLDYRLLRSKRRTIGFLIDDEGLRVTAPRWVTISEIEAAIVEKQRWIVNKINEQRERAVRQLQPPMQWRDGAMLPYLGADIVVRLRIGDGSGVHFDEAAGALHVSLPAQASEQQLKDRVQGWLQMQAKTLFAERLALYADKLGVRFASLTLSSAATQWGSCTTDGRIRLNWRLMHFALPHIDYVVAHELAHLREMNHGPSFWATVQSVFPEFETARKALRDHARESLPVF